MTLIYKLDLYWVRVNYHTDYHYGTHTADLCHNSDH